MQEITIGQLFPGRRFFVLTHDGERMALRFLGKTRLIKGGTKLLVGRPATQEETWISSKDIAKMFIA